MVKLKIFFRADADSKIGYGHFVRSLALAEMLKDDFDCTFFTQEPTEYQINEVAKVCKLVALPSGDSKFDLFLSYLTGEEIVFLDNYFFTYNYEKKIKDIGCRLVCLAPYTTPHCPDILINYIETDLTKYSVESHTRIYAGLEWVILRPPFRLPVEKNKQDSNIITICYGGTDQFELTEKTWHYLSKYIGYDIHLIASGAIDKQRVERFVSEGISVHINIPAEEVACLFENSKYAVLSSSMVCLEALSRGVTVLAGYYVDNQVGLHKILSDTKSIIDLGNLLENDFSGILEHTLSNNIVLNSSIDFSTQKNNYITLFKSLC